ncbi:MAG: membrane protein insertion efficiency factor YidD [Coriobacteriia bacterium]|nr:membrane protein insertion efficiency factor YidD [Coriobacteriia bacterium]
MKAVGRIVFELPKRCAIILIQCYRVLVSPLFPSACRFVPTCSAYASGSIEKHGFLRGGWLAVKRIAKCHPFHPGGWDPVP